MRPLVFVLSLAALLFVLLQVASDSRAYNDSDEGHGSAGTHYMQCTYGDHARWPYTDYSETNMFIKSRFYGVVPQAYKDLYIYAAVYWNIQPTRVSHTPATLGTNVWMVFDDPDEINAGETIAICINTGTGNQPDTTFLSAVSLNRAHLDGELVIIARNIALHELGHEMMLGHSDQLFEYPLGLMYSPLIFLYTQPQPDDVCGVNALYRSNTYPVTATCHSDHSLPPP